MPDSTDFAATLARAVGRERVDHDRIRDLPLHALEVSLGREAPAAGSRMAPLRHWLLFPQVYPLERAGLDGHERTGDFLPDMGARRRMWAGGSVSFHAPLRIGDAVERTTRIEALEEKQGRSGALVFARLEHRIAGPAGLGVIERQTLVYRDPPQPGDPEPAPETPPQDALWSEETEAGPLLLFRYSALTFNGHRIHYDHPHATETEGYEGLVVHGPLLATLMADLARDRSGGRALAEFSFRGHAPVIADRPFRVEGRPEADGDGAALWVVQGDRLAMSARCRFA